jgi:two-component system sensor histidine kinase GlrK
MKFKRPRTLLGLVLIGLGIATLPLLVAIGNAVINLGTLADQSGIALEESALATREAQMIGRRLFDMERNGRSYFVVPDKADLLTIYDGDQRALEKSLGALRSFRGDELVSAHLARIETTSKAVQDMVRKGPAAGRLDVVVNGFRVMNEAAQAMSQRINTLIDERLTALRESTRAAQRTLAWQAAALVPGMLVLVLFFLLLVGRPLRQIDRAISELGEGDFSRTITVRGPQDLETLGTQLEWLRHRLHESTEEKNKFLRHMSHELKTPLANIREGTELLLDGSVGKLEREQEEVASILRDNGVKLQKLIENLLMFSAWQTQTASLDITSFDLKPMVFSVLGQHRLAISNKKIKLDLNVSAIAVRADEGKLKLVLENLLSNAIKFTPRDGKIEISAGMYGNELVIVIGDSGPGVDPADAERIFEAFYQGRRLHGGPVAGTGIGLSVVAECVQAHGGSVRLMPDAGTGARFEVRLPLRRASDKPRLAVVVNG